MTRLYIEAGIALVAALIFTFLGWHFGSLHWKGQYQAVLVDDAQASAKATADADAKIKKARETYDTQLEAITNAYHTETAASDAANDGLARSLRAYADRLSSCTVRAGASAAERADESARRASRAREIAEATAGLARATERDDKKLTSLQAERRAISAKPQ